jgi:ABC-2 type transport system ATP-binding protein
MTRLSDPVAIARGIVKRFGDGAPALDGVDLEIGGNCVTGLVGPDGAGKTTMIRLLAGLMAPDEGEITILDGMKPGHDAAKQIGYLPEERGLYPKMKVLDMIVFMGELRGLKHHDAKQRATKWLERLGLAQWAKNKVQDLSKGMAQKVQFATALIHEPALVILDEPWSGLDPINAEVLHQVVDEIRASGRTVLFSTHGMEQAEKIVDNVCIIARGKKVLDGRLKDIKRASAAEGVVALAFADELSKERATGPLEDPKLVIERKPPRPGEHADCEVVLADGVTPQQLLKTLLNHDVGLRLFEIVVPTLHQIFVQKVGAAAAVAERREGDRQGEDAVA